MTLLAALSSARSTQALERSSDPFLYERDLTDPPLPACVVPCGPGCAGPYSSDTPPNPARRRSVSSVDSNADVDRRDFDAVFAGSEVQSPNPQFVAKRNFFKVTEGNVDSWVKNKVSSKTKTTVQLCFAPEGKFCQPSSLGKADFRCAGDQTSTTVQQTFDQTNKYELGTGGLVGCTVLTVVSRRGVFMAHFFESLAFSRPTKKQLEDEGEDPAAYPKLDFTGQVTNLIDQSRGATKGLGPSLDVSLFNQDGDNTQAFIMTPRKWGGSAGQWQFTNRVGQIQAQVQALLTGIVTAVPVTDYVRLNMADPAQEAQLYTNARGSAFFQYDPDNRGSQGWRLFYEQVLVSEDGW